VRIRLETDESVRAVLREDGPAPVGQGGRRVGRANPGPAAEDTPEQVDEAALVLLVEERVQDGVDAAVRGAEPGVGFGIAGEFNVLVGRGLRTEGPDWTPP
jgi:hypothetical protein